MYSLRDKSRYGTISSEFNVISQSNINDFNEEEINGIYSPILVIHRPAKYNKGQYVLEDTHYVYIKRQPLKALIKQERLEEKGIDSIGAIVYKKLGHDLCLLLLFGCVFLQLLYCVQLGKLKLCIRQYACLLYTSKSAVCNNRRYASTLVRC